MDEIIPKAKSSMFSALESIKKDLATIRTGKASPSLVENIEVVVYGGAQKLKIMELGTVSAPDARSLIITPWDQSISGEIAKGILSANVGLTPANDGNLIRISIPPMTEERRLELVKSMHQKMEGGKVMLRQVRHEAMEDIKKSEDAGEISEDEKKKLEKDLQELTDNMIAEVESLGKDKEADLMAI